LIKTNHYYDKQHDKIIKKNIEKRVYIEIERCP